MESGIDAEKNAMLCEQAYNGVIGEIGGTHPADYVEAKSQYAAAIALGAIAYELRALRKELSK